MLMRLRVPDDDNAAMIYCFFFDALNNNTGARATDIISTTRRG